MKSVISVLSILLGFVFIFNTELCDYIYDYSNPLERLEWINLRYRIYESLLFLSVLIAFLSTKKRIHKSMLSFVIVLLFFSLSDKIIFKLNSYSYTDILVLFISVIVSFIIFNKCPQNKQ